MLLFVAAHWDELSPSGRFSLVLLLVSVFHVAGALTASRFPVLAAALHGIGTIARPRVWIQVAPDDPSLPIRGRYLAFSWRLPAEGFTPRENPAANISPFLQNRCDLVVRNAVLTAVANEDGENWVNVRLIDNKPIAIAYDDTPFFIGEHVNIPVLRQTEELWMEVTLPRKGPPRPIRLATKKDGVLTPLALD